MRKADRLFQLVNLIRVRQPVTAAVLAAELGLSVRSIYRYVDDLSVAGIPVYGEAGIGYRLDPAFELPPLSLDAAEAGFNVGYESPSQFSRDYSRLFGLPPATDAQRLRWAEGRSCGTP